MPIVRDGGYIKYANGKYTDLEGILKTKIGCKVNIVEGWKPGEIMIMDVRKFFICHAYQVTENNQDTLIKMEENDYQKALKCVYKVLQGDSLETVSLFLTGREKSVILPLIETLLQSPDGMGRWKNTRERVWWNFYREVDEWQLMCIYEKKRIGKFSTFIYTFNNNSTQREFHGRYLSLAKAKKVLEDKAYRRSRWIPERRMSYEYIPSVQKQKTRK